MSSDSLSDEVEALCPVCSKGAPKGLCPLNTFPKAAHSLARRVRKMERELSNTQDHLAAEESIGDQCTCNAEGGQVHKSNCNRWRYMRFVR